MGMDAVELVIRFEEAFGIRIPDEVAEQLTTPRKVTDYVFAQVAVTAESSCLSQQAFYFLRGKFEASMKIPRSGFRPSTRLEGLIPLERRRQVWAGIKSEIGSSALPDLARPMWLFSTLSLLTVLTFISALIHAWNNANLGSNSGFFLGLLGAVVVGYSGAFVTRPWKRHFRRGYESVGSLAKYISIYSPQSFKGEKKGWSREQVASVVREIIIDQVGAKDFTEDSHFINDMHLD